MIIRQDRPKSTEVVPYECIEVCSFLFGGSAKNNTGVKSEMKKIEIENAIIELDNIALVAKLVSEADLTFEELQRGCIVLRELIDSKVADIEAAFYE